MARVRSRNTRPELIVRSYLHRQGLRFRIHRVGLPGSPDIVLPGRRTVVFVHGCFWHRHESCSRATIPKTRRGFWFEKFGRNVARDAAATAALRKLGWHVEIIWECQIKDERHMRRLAARIARRGPP
jgi:DNA mismatch endonuclease, patch repair protein